jgi:hypothetical protein
VGGRMTINEAIKEVEKYGNVEKLTSDYKVTADNDISRVVFFKQSESDIIKLGETCKNNKTNLHPLLSNAWMEGEEND